VEKQTALAVRWMGPAAFALLSVSEDFAARNGGTAAMTGVAIESASKYTSANGDICDFNERLAELCRDPMRRPSDQVHGWGLIQASQIIMARSRPPLGKKTRVLSDEQLEKINSYIEENLPNAISVETLARVAGVGKDQFARLFKQTRGRPPYHHVLRFRAMRAQELIEEGKLSRSEIAERTGFSDQNHMKKTIRRLFGKSPKIRFCPENNTGASDTGVEKQGTLMGTL
jgi:AraC family transcriptional regulator